MWSENKDRASYLHTHTLYKRFFLQKKKKHTTQLMGLILESKPIDDDSWHHRRVDSYTNNKRFDEIYSILNRIFKMNREFFSSIHSLFKLVDFHFQFYKTFNFTSFFAILNFQQKKRREFLSKWLFISFCFVPASSSSLWL